MEDAIRKFTKTVKKGQYFDTHTVIQYLIQKHTDLYLNSVCRTTVQSYHGYIGQFIKETFATELEHVGTSRSKNIKDGFSECALWRKK